MHTLKLPARYGKKITFILLALVFPLLLSACSDRDSAISIAIKPSFDDREIGCNSKFKVQDQVWWYQQIQFYITNVELQTPDGQWQAWPMQTTPFQGKNVALVGEHCLQGENKGANWQLVLMPIAASDLAKRIRFTLGVPFELNHLNPITQPSPLNVSSMFWVWQTGHKFMRIELANENDDWLFHLGSTGCKAASPLRAPGQECLYPNRVEVELPFDISNAVMEFDVSALLSGVRLSRETGCQSKQGDKHCQQLFSNLGLSGQPPAQIVFREDK